MLAVLVVAAIMVTAWPLACSVSRPATGSTRERDAERRARYVARNPHEVNTADLRSMLIAENLGPSQVDFVSVRAHELGIRPFTMLVWLKCFDAESLATVIAADLSQDELIAHVAHEALPDLAELRVFAELNGFTGIGETRSIDLPTRSCSRSAVGKWAMQDGAPVTPKSLGLYDLPPDLDGGQDRPGRRTA